MSCFACEPDRVPVAERRYLCQAHKAVCVLDDDVSLQSAIALASPKGHPLEGSLLAFVYNPVFVRDAHDRSVRAITDFAAGGMAVYETLYAEETRFGLWVSARDEWRPILRAMLRVPRWVSTISALELSGDALSVVDDAANMWWREHCAAERRRRVGRWPASYAELVALLRPPDREQEEQRDDAAFITELRECAAAARSRGAV